jgi:hypothetical protein
MSDYTPVNPIKISINNKTYVYDYMGLTFRQVALAEELANFKREQLANPPESLYLLQRSGMDEYKGMLAAHLFKPEGEKWNKENLSVYEADLSEVEVMQFEEIEKALYDFFYRRGLRTVASETLTRDGSWIKGLTELMKVGNSILLNQQEGEQSSLNQENLIDELPEENATI